MIYHDGYVFLGKAQNFEEGPPDVPLQEISSPGTFGVSHLLGPPGGRPLRCFYTLDGFISQASVHAAVRDMQFYAGRLTGSVINDDFDTVQYDNCTFMGFQPSGPPYYSAGGTMGWVQQGWLEWIQRQF